MNHHPSRKQVPIVSKSAWELYQEQQQQSSHTPTPHLLHPTLPLHVGSVTELVGPAGSGKTQLCITACCDCLMQSPSSSVLYVMLAQDRSRATAWRLQGMLQTRQEEAGAGATQKENHKTQHHHANNHDLNTMLQQYLRRFWMRSIRNADELLELLQTGLSQFLEQRRTAKQPVRIIVLDGLAHLFRVAENYMERSSTFFEMSSLLKQLSSQYQVSILCTNQVTSRLPSSDDEQQQPQQQSKTHFSSTETLQPALGLSWAQCCNSSFMVKRNSKQRRLVAQRSPFLPSNHTVPFELQPQGAVVAAAKSEPIIIF
jgi:RecA/RadA recombinase